MIDPAARVALTIALVTAALVAGAALNALIS